MKKLLLVLLVVTLASFLFVGCIPVTPSEGEGEGEGEAEICPTVAVTSQVAVAGKNYIKAGSQTVTVTFAVPTEPVSVYVGALLKDNPVGVPTSASEVVMYTADGGLTYTGTVLFAGDCDEAYIYVLTCDTCAPCKYPYTVDGVGPASEIKISKAACVCEGCTIEFDSTADSTDCADTDTCCGDDCSGFGSYAIDLYTTMPFDECCDIPCATPAYSCPGGVTCPIDCTLDCITGTTTTTDKVYYMVATLLDNVGNRTRYYATLTLDSGCGLVVQEYAQEVDGETALCSDYETELGSAQTVATANPAEIGLCLE
jgi:hypothetical protein